MLISTCHSSSNIFLSFFLNFFSFILRVFLLLCLFLLFYFHVLILSSVFLFIPSRFLFFVFCFFCLFSTVISVVFWYHSNTTSYSLSSFFFCFASLLFLSNYSLSSSIFALFFGWGFF